MLDRRHFLKVLAAIGAFPSLAAANACFATPPVHSLHTINVDQFKSALLLLENNRGAWLGRFKKNPEFANSSGYVSLRRNPWPGPNHFEAYYPNTNPLEANYVIFSKTEALQLLDCDQTKVNFAFNLDAMKIGDRKIFAKGLRKVIFNHDYTTRSNTITLRKKNAKMV